MRPAGDHSIVGAHTMREGVRLDSIVGADCQTERKEVPVEFVSVERLV